MSLSLSEGRQDWPWNCFCSRKAPLGHFSFAMMVTRFVVFEISIHCFYSALYNKSFQGFEGVFLFNKKTLY